MMYIMQTSLCDVDIGNSCALNTFRYTSVTHLKKYFELRFLMLLIDKIEFKNFTFSF